MQRNRNGEKIEIPVTPWQLLAALVYIRAHTENKSVRDIELEMGITPRVRSSAETKLRCAIHEVARVGHDQALVNLLAGLYLFRIELHRTQSLNCPWPDALKQFDVPRRDGAVVDPVVLVQECLASLDDEKDFLGDSVKRYIESLLLPEEPAASQSELEAVRFRRYQDVLRQSFVFTQGIQEELTRRRLRIYRRLEELDQ